MPPMTSIVTGTRAKWGVSDCGQLMGKVTESGIASIETEGVYEHLAVGVLEEGYTLAYKVKGEERIKYHVWEQSEGIICGGNHICRDDSDEFVKIAESKTNDGLIAIRNTFIIPKNNTRVVIRMEITHCAERESFDVADLLIKRYADIDVDTGGNAGWADYKAHWNKNRYSVFSYTLPVDAPEGRRAHTVNMVAMPGNIPLEGTYVGKLGSQQYKFRDNPNLLSPLPTGRVDGDGILQWYTPRLLPGETIQINMYYETYRSFSR